MLEITCDRCKEKLTEPGGLLFDPPVFNGVEDTVVKRHACTGCWEQIDKLFEGCGDHHRYPEPNSQGFPVDQCLDCGAWRTNAEP